MRQTAYLCGWSPSEFWEATLGDLVLAIAAYNQRRTHDHHLAAWHVHHVINLVAKPRIKLEQLLPNYKPVRTFNPAMFGGDVMAMKRAIDNAMEQDARAAEEAALYG